MLERLVRVDVNESYFRDVWIRLQRGLAIAGIVSERHVSGSTLPTMNTHATTPKRDIAEVMAKGQKKFPVWSRTNPVSDGPIIPAKLAKPFCGPYHRPTASGPAMRWQ